FEGETDVIPRSMPPGVEPLMVVAVDMQKQSNETNHYTMEYMTDLLVVRRAQQFAIGVTFNRPLVPSDDFQLEFLIGSDPSSNSNTRVVVTFGNRGGGGSWSGKILGASGAVVSLGITPNPKAVVGLYRMYVAIANANGMRRTEKDPKTNFYLLFNAWSPDDDVFYPDEAGRMEYVMNETGLISQGAVGSISDRGWVYGQFHDGILDCCIYLMDACRMPVQQRGDVIKMVRTASALLTYLEGSLYVKRFFLPSVLRCLGIPSRVVSNFNSAHDNNGNLRTELVFKMDDTPDRERTVESIWNFHVWNEVFIKRSDLPPKYSGWQVVDATPQETSDGYYRCGPAPVIAIRDGELCFPFDLGFVFAEVNSDVHFMRSDRYGNLTPYKVDTEYVGKVLLTKAVGMMASEDITRTYKHPEGPIHTWFDLLQQHNSQSNHDNGSVGDPVKVAVTILNQGDQRKSVMVTLDISTVYYTGVPSSDPIRVGSFDLDVEGLQREHRISLVFYGLKRSSHDCLDLCGSVAEETRTFEIPAKDYIPQLKPNSGLEITATGRTDDETVTEVQKLALKPPPMNVKVNPRCDINEIGYLNITIHTELLIDLNVAKLSEENEKLKRTER
uniref:Transglutaminase-like domain-containing protein n=1 Tax=Cyprinodon variegatus TaxID=28743 RepID=A0A3Q2CVW8_CYPVA